MVTYKGFVTSTFLYMTQRYASVTPALQNYKRDAVKGKLYWNMMKKCEYTFT